MNLNCTFRLTPRLTDAPIYLTTLVLRKFHSHESPIIGAFVEIKTQWLERSGREVGVNKKENSTVNELLVGLSAPHSVPICLPWLFLYPKVDLETAPITASHIILNSYSIIRCSDADGVEGKQLNPLIFIAIHKWILDKYAPYQFLYGHEQSIHNLS